ncbi:hypothetical protein ACFLZ7_01765 [Nanoarchaeota archaeon]
MGGQKTIFTGLDYFEDPHHLVIGRTHINTPDYKVHHLHKIVPSKIKEFVEHLSTVHSLKTDINYFPADTEYGCLEGLVRTVMGDKPIEEMSTLNQNEDNLQYVMRCFGVAPELFELFLSIEYSNALGKLDFSNGFELIGAITQFSLVGKSKYPGIDPNRLAETKKKITHELILPGMIGGGDLLKATKEFQKYRELVMAYEFMQDDIMEFMKAAKGKIGVLLPLPYAKKMKAMLEGRLLEEPEIWDQHKDEMNEETVGVIDMLEAVISGDDPKSIDRPGDWHNEGRPGPLGDRRDQRSFEWDQKYGMGNWRLVWKWADDQSEKYLSFERACKEFEGAYSADFSSNPEKWKELAREAREVYDIEERDIDSGLDYMVQKGRANHIQDIAIRNVLKKNGLQFTGDKLAQVRGARTKWGSLFSPTRIMFHKPHQIKMPHLINYCHPQSTEAFWQNNKYLQVRR